jgi:hypothetical protein
MPKRPRVFKLFAEMPLHWESRGACLTHPALTQRFLVEWAEAGRKLSVIALFDLNRQMLLPNGEIGAAPGFKVLRERFIQVDKGLAGKLCASILEAVKAKEEA